MVVVVEKKWSTASFTAECIISIHQMALGKISDLRGSIKSPSNHLKVSSKGTGSGVADFVLPALNFVNSILLSFLFQLKTISIVQKSLAVMQFLCNENK